MVYIYYIYICKMDPFLRKQHGSFHPLIISSTTWDLDNLPDAVWSLVENIEGVQGVKKQNV